MSNSLWPHGLQHPGLLVHHQLPELAQTHVHGVGGPSNHLILCYPLLLWASIFPSITVLPVRWLFTSGGQSIRASASASVLPMNIQGWFPLGWTVLILLSKGLSRVFSSNIETCIQQFIPFTFYKVNLIPKSAKKSDKGQPDLICTPQLVGGWCKLPFPVPIWQTSKGRLGMLKDCMDTAAEQGVQSSWSLVPLLRDARPWGDDV